MAETSFVDFVVDQLGALPEVRARAMFGAHGLYQAGRFFAIVDQGRLFFKTDERSHLEYAKRAMPPFTFEVKGRVVTMDYHEVPADVLESATELVEWARGAIAVAARTRAARDRKGRGRTVGRRPAGRRNQRTR